MDCMASAAAPPSTRPAEQVAPGDLLAGKYRVERMLGRGAMGVVVAARHIQLEQIVAIKLLAPEAMEDEVAIERFLREARAAAKLRSDHVARVLDVGRLDDRAPYMVMEYLDGADLGEVLDLEGPFSPEIACEYIVQACDAVAEAHARGIVHRDLKPENLYLTTRVGGAWMVKVLDFGLSKVLTEKQGALTQTRAVMGSPLYMAPEQLRSSRSASPPSDVWALGVVLFELLTRCWPFEAESLPELCLKVTREPPRALHEVRGDVPAGLVAVVERCLEKEPEARYPDAAALAVALEPFLSPASRPLVARSRSIAQSLVETQAADAGKTHPGARPSRRPTWIALAVALAAAGGGRLSRWAGGARRPIRSRSPPSRPPSRPPESPAPSSPRRFRPRHRHRPSQPPPP